MDDRDFHRVRGQVLDLHREGRYREALLVAEEASQNFSEKEAETSYWIACLECRLGDLDGALGTLQEALKKGHWWAEHWLTQDPDLEPLRDRQPFQEIVTESRRRQKEAQARAKPKLLVLPPKRHAQKGMLPLLIALHWFGGTAQEFAPFWEAARKAGFLIALPQSSQMTTEDGFGWDDREQAQREIETHWKQLNRSYQIDPERVILAGASQGGRIAIELALKSDLLLCRGFIAVVPAIREPEELAVRGKGAGERGLRGWILTGEYDHFRLGAKRLCELLQEEGVPCALVVVPGLGHDFPEAFGVRLVEALKFVFGKQ